MCYNHLKEMIILKYQYDFNNLHLPTKEYYLLKFSKYGKRKYHKKYDNLIETDMMNFTVYIQDEIGQPIPDKMYCKITEKGICYLKYCQNHFVDIRIPIILSIIAIIISFFVR